MKLGLEVPVDCSKRPMCAMYCENGFVTGQDGCPICECKELGEGIYTVSEQNVIVALLLVSYWYHSKCILWYHSSLGNPS